MLFAQDSPPVSATLVSLVGPSHRAGTRTLSREAEMFLRHSVTVLQREIADPFNLPPISLVASRRKCLVGCQGIREVISTGRAEGEQALPRAPGPAIVAGATPTVLLVFRCGHFGRCAAILGQVMMVCHIWLAPVTLLNASCRVPSPLSRAVPVAGKLGRGGGAYGTIPQPDPRSPDEPREPG